MVPGVDTAALIGVVQSDVDALLFFNGFLNGVEGQGVHDLLLGEVGAVALDADALAAQQLHDFRVANGPLLFVVMVRFS